MTHSALDIHAHAGSPTELGVGARFSLFPMTDGFVDVILDALDAADASDVTVQTDDVSTYVVGDEQAIVRYLVEVLRRAAQQTSTGHVVASIMLSRGCPGEVTCEIGDDVALAPAQPFELASTGVAVAAHWSLYPLGADDHLTVIEAAVEQAREAGVYAGSEHYATRLEGDLAKVLGTVAAAWTTIGATVQHVTTHVTVSIGSPTPRPGGDR